MASSQGQITDITTAADYHRVTQASGKLVVVQFTATWCGPCRRVAPQFQNLARQHPDVDFNKVYEHNCREVIISAGVRAFPTFHFFIDGRKVDEARGANIRAVEGKVLQHKAAVKPALGPVTAKLQVERERPRESGTGTILAMEEIDIDVDASEGLEVLTFQILSLTDVEAEEQVLTAGDGTPITTAANLEDALRQRGGGLYGNYPLLRMAVKKRGHPSEVSSPEPGPSNTEADDGIVSSAWLSCCSRVFFGPDPLVQPAFVLREEAHMLEAAKTPQQRKGKGKEDILLLCKACAETCFTPGKVEPCPGVSGVVPFACAVGEACAKGYCQDLYAERVAAGAETLQPASASHSRLSSTALEAALDMQRAAGSTGVDAMHARVRRGVEGVLAYEDTQLQAKALACMPADALRQAAREKVAQGGHSMEEELATALLQWFKRDFFKWTNKPPCSACMHKGPNMQHAGTANPSPEERAGWASVVEVYRCLDCEATTRFPRYNHPGKLLETRQGRCGEWANCFTLMCQALGLEARHVIDFTDHVWTEIWIQALSRWVHADACEKKLDSPLMYEKGWNKRLTYVLAFQAEAVVDVTRRYTRRYVQVLSRRRQIPEQALVELTERTTGGLLERLQARGLGERVQEVWGRLEAEQRELKGYETMDYGAAVLQAAEQEGRQSGDKAWINARSEGTDVDGQGLAPSPTAAGTLLGVPQCSPDGGLTVALVVSAVSVGPQGSGPYSSSSISVGSAQVGGPSDGPGLRLVAVGSDGRLVQSLFFASGPGLAKQVGEFLALVPDGTMVAACASRMGSEGLGQGQEAALTPMLEGLVHSPGKGLRLPRDGDGWALVGWKGLPTPAWARWERRATGQGPCCVSVEVVMRLPAAFLGQAEFPDTLCANALALCPGGDMQSGAGGTLGGPGRQEEGEEEEEKGGARADAAGYVQGAVRGFCHHAGGGEQPLLVGPTCAQLDHSPGWTTVLMVPRRDGNGDDGDGGVGGDGADTAHWRALSLSPCHGGWHEDTEAFDDSVAGCPSMSMGGDPFGQGSHSGMFPVARVKEVIVWSGDFVNGVQVVYDVQGNAFHGPRHLGDHGSYRQCSLTLDVEGGEAVTEVLVRAGGVVDGLCIKTSKGQEVSWGGQGGETATFTLQKGHIFLGFHGGIGGHLHRLGVATLEQHSSADASPCPWPSLKTAAPALVPFLVQNMYSTDVVRKAAAQMLCMHAAACASRDASSNGPGEVLGPVVLALETVQRYCTNLVDQPLNPKFARIRLGNKFFQTRLGHLLGSGCLLQALGFKLVSEAGVLYSAFQRHRHGHLKEAARDVIPDLVHTLKRAQ